MESGPVAEHPGATILNYGAQPAGIDLFDFHYGIKK
jgi:hypothetical protein